ncbi:MAG TPA: acyl carrier protein [Pyrinomonadaceae bacterium]|nr:acyl carrier protein [Pyrinomonadaceae bacterium]
MSKLQEFDRRVRAVAARVFDLSGDGVQEDLRMGNPPQWDSIGHMELLVAIETEFGVRFQSRDIASLITLDAIVQAVAQQDAR